MKSSIVVTGLIRIAKQEALRGTATYVDPYIIYIQFNNDSLRQLRQKSIDSLRHLRQILNVLGWK
jgi:hypothetical protein